MRGSVGRWGVGGGLGGGWGRRACRSSRGRDWGRWRGSVSGCCLCGGSWSGENCQRGRMRGGRRVVEYLSEQ